MTNDISNILRDFPFEPGQINARLIPGQDGEPKVQVRLDLGILQMQLDGRPDGSRPYDYESLLEYFEAVSDGRAPTPEEAAAEVGEEAGESESSETDRSEDNVYDGATKPENFKLSPDHCRMLREEAAQFYQRYLALLVLEDFARVVRDTTRNLRVIDFCKKYATNDEDRGVLEQFRPYITMMRARALAGQALKENEPKAAVIAIDEAINAIQTFYSDAGRPQLFDQSNEVQMLRGMRDALVPKLPVSLKSELKERLQRALAQENYELAAILRDELKQMKE